MSKGKGKAMAKQPATPSRRAKPSQPMTSIKKVKTVETTPSSKSKDVKDIEDVKSLSEIDEEKYVLRSILFSLLILRTSSWNAAVPLPEQDNTLDEVFNDKVIGKVKKFYSNRWNIL